MRGTLGKLAGAAAAIALTWGMLNLLDVGACGGDGTPACPPEATPYFLALVGGMLGLFVARFIGPGGGAMGLLVLPLASVGLTLKAVYGRAPGERAGMLAAAFIVSAITLFLLVGARGAVSKGRKAAWLTQHGSKARGHLEGIRETGVRINEQPRVELTVRVEPLDGQQPFTATKTVTVSDVAPPRIGNVFPVWFDPADRETWAIGLPDSSGRPDPALVEEFGLSFDGVGGDADDLSRIAALERLARLRDIGALSESEFEREKDRLLD